MASRWFNVLSLLWPLLATGIHPALAETAAQHCEKIGRDLASGLSIERIKPLPDAELLAGLLTSDNSPRLEPLMGFESGEYFSDVWELKEYLAPAMMSARIFVNLPPAGDSVMAYDLRKRLDRIVVVDTGSESSCLSVTTLARDRQSQQISMATPTLSCEAQSWNVVKIKDGGTYVALLDLPQKHFDEISVHAERAYNLALYGVGVEDENSVCRFRIGTDATAQILVDEARSINAMLLGAMIDAGPESPQQKVIQAWLQQHGADIARAYLDKMSGQATAMSWPQDVSVDGIALAGGRLEGDCGVTKPRAAGEILSVIVYSIADLTGVQCGAAASDHVLHGRVKTAVEEFLVSVSSEAGIVSVNGYSWDVAGGKAQLAAILRAREIPATRKLTITRVEDD